MLLAIECANAMGKDTMHSLSFSSEIASIHDNDTMKTHGWGDGLDSLHRCMHLKYISLM